MGGCHSRDHLLLPLARNQGPSENRARRRGRLYKHEKRANDDSIDCHKCERRLLYLVTLLHFAEEFGPQAYVLLLPGLQILWAVVTPFAAGQTGFMQTTKERMRMLAGSNDDPFTSLHFGGTHNSGVRTLPLASSAVNANRGKVRPFIRAHRRNSLYVPRMILDLHHCIRGQNSNGSYVTC